MLDNKEEQRFDFKIVIEPKSRGDLGALRIGGLMRSIKECFDEYQEMKGQIERHVDGVGRIDIVIDDQFGALNDIESEWLAEELKDLPLNEAMSKIGFNDFE